tara:strand:- start:456 stop:839 length:384 start_codon:yes stop_codon:yes gene_type:complete
MRINANISSLIRGSNPNNIIPKKETNISIHFFKLTVSFKKKELSNIANGIASCDPIIIGETIPASFKDNVIKTLAKKPIDTEKQKRGNQYFLSGILNFQKGIKQMKTTSILKLPINRGGTFSLKITF